MCSYSPPRYPGWYETPERTLATAATADDLRRDGIDVKKPPVGATQAELLDEARR
jgi:hypothetical protein